MSEITLVRQDLTEITEADRAVVRRVLFNVIDGLGERGKRQWRRLVNSWLRLQPGEMSEITTYQARLLWFHRKHMALEQALFEAQERFEDFETFRTWLKVGAGFVIWCPGPKGGVFPVPRSISFAKLEQGEMEQFHNDAIAFLRTEHAGAYLWKHLKPMARVEMLEGVLGDFRE